MKRVQWLPCVLGLVGLLLGGCASQEAAAPKKAEEAQILSKNAEKHAQLAAAYFEIEQYEIALEETRKTLDLDATNMAAYAIQALIYMKLKQEPEAEQAFRQAFALSPNDSDLLHNYGVFLCQKNKIREALDYFERAMKNPLYSKPERSMFAAAGCLNNANASEADINLALRFYERGLLKRPNHPVGLLGMAGIKFRRQDFLGAAALLADYHKQFSPSAASQYMAWQTAHALGRKEDEANAALVLMRDFPKSDEAKKMLQSGPAGADSSASVTASKQEKAQ